MFAIFLSDKMDPFYQNILSFPTAVFSALLILCILFWLVAILGLLDISFLDISGSENGLEVSDAASVPDAVAGIILKLGLNGVPLTIVITLITLIGWFICYYIVDFLFGIIPDGLIRYALGVPVVLVSFYFAALATAQIIKPLRKNFKGLEQDVEKIVLGQTAIVRTSKVDAGFGEAALDDGGAGLILKVRATGDSTFKKGDRVVLIEYLSEANTFRVVSEEEFKGL